MHGGFRGGGFGSGTHGVLAVVECISRAAGSLAAASVAA